MPRVTAEHLAARREQIMVAAETCFSRAGFHKTTMQDIIAESGLSAGAIYNYFRGKDELIESIAHERHVDERAVLAEMADNADLRAGLKILGRRFADELLTPAGKRRRRVGVLAWAEALLNPAVARSMRKGLDGPRAAIANLTHRANQKSGFPAPLNPDAIARTIIAMYHGFVIQMLWDSETPHGDMMEAFDLVIDTLIPADDPNVNRKAPTSEPRAG